MLQVCRKAFAVLRGAPGIDEIRQQLAYRESNQAQLEGFRPTKTFNEGMVIYLDDVSRRFVITRSSDYKKGNPDLIDCAKVLSAEYTVNEDRDEIYEDEKERKSYDPPKYKYEYTFNMKLTVDHPYFDTIRFEVKCGERPDSKVSVSYRSHEKLCNMIQNALRPDLYPLKEYPEVQSIGSAFVGLINDLSNAFTGGTELKEGEWKCTCGTINTTRFCGNCGKERPQPLRWYCPNCGKENNGKFCVACGTKMPDSVGK